MGTERGVRGLEKIAAWLAPNLAAAVLTVPPERWPLVEEIRLRAGRPLQLRLGDEEMWPRLEGEPVLVTAEDIARTLNIMTAASIYAYEAELSKGYLTLPGGHRVGIAGKVLRDGNKIRGFQHFGSLNIRLARQYPGVGEKLLPQLLDKVTGRLHSTLIISPPRCGKTTLLRDLVRLASSGWPAAGLAPLTVGLVDERSEIAGCYQGIPQLEVGPRTDVLDGCPKAEGLSMLIRTMGPELVVCDEIGTAADQQALLEAANNGAILLASIHGAGINDLARRPFGRELLALRLFQRIVVLSRREGPGTVEKVYLR